MNATIMGLLAGVLVVPWMACGARAGEEPGGEAETETEAEAETGAGTEAVAETETGAGTEAVAEPMCRTTETESETESESESESGVCSAALSDDIRADGRAGGDLIVIWKSEYKLGFYREGDLADVEGDGSACFDVALGFEPEGAKTVRGDGKTPEGWYWVAWKIPEGKTSFYKALYVNYPNADDAARALKEGQIGQSTHDRIVRSANKKSTVTDSPLGSLIEIHGSGNWPKNWTLGCVALDNGDMDWLYDASAGGKTAIRILP